MSTQTRGDAISHVNRGFVPAVLLVGTRARNDVVESVDAIRRVSPATRVVFLADSLATATVLGRSGQCAVIIKPFEVVDLIRAVHVMARTPDNTMSQPPDSYRDGEIDEIAASNPPLSFFRFVWPWIAALLLVAIAWLLTEFLSRIVTP